MNLLLRALGFDLGRHYHAALAPRLGEDWLERLRVQRLQDTGEGRYRRRINLYDPSFCLTEPLHDPRSPLRGCLPRDKAFYDLLDAAVQVRNAEQHFDGLLHADRLVAGSRTIQALANRVQLPVAQDAEVLLGRIRELQTNPDAHRALTSSEAEALRRRLVDDAAAAEKLQRDVADLQARERRARTRWQRAEADAGRSAAEREALAAELDALRERFEQAVAAQELAMEQAAAARRELSHLSMERLRDQPNGDADNLGPGDPWPHPPGSRVVRLIAHIQDLLDPASGELLTEQYGEAAALAARQWLDRLPHGGTIHLTDAGHAAHFTGSGWVYLGQL
jgi:hypothetical protein